MSPSLLEDGTYFDVDRARYDAIDRVNFSSLKFMDKSAKHYRHNKLQKKGKATDEMMLGNALHVATFEPESFERRVIRWDGGARKGEEWDEFAEEHQDKTILTVKGWDACLAMSAAVRSDEAAQKYLQGGAGEMTLLFQAQGVESEAVAAKMRIDFDSNLAIADLKSSSRYQPGPFSVQADNLHYDAQAAWYSDGYLSATGTAKPYKLVVVESSPPYDVIVYPVTERSLAVGREKYQRWLDQLAWCRKHSRWPGFAAGVEIDLPLPSWRGPDKEEQDTLDTLTSGGKPLHLERD